MHNIHIIYYANLTIARIISQIFLGYPVILYPHLHQSDHDLHATTYTSQRIRVQFKKVNLMLNTKILFPTSVEHTIQYLTGKFLLIKG